MTLVGRTLDCAAATKTLGYPDRRPTSPMWCSSARAIAIGALLGAMVYKVGSVPLTLSTSGGG